MLILILGAAASGKSELAESVCLRLAGKEPSAPTLLYVAAMRPEGEEAERRIRRHRELRRGKGFETIEAYTDPAGRVGSHMQAGSLKKSIVLLECLSNLAANCLFSEEGKLRDPDRTEKEIRENLQHLLEAAGHLVLVGSDVFSDGILYPAETESYRRVLAALQQWAAKRADLVIESVCGFPLCLKGSFSRLMGNGEET